MAILTYNTDDPHATAQGYTPLAGNGTLTLAPIMTGVASKAAGSVYSDVAGTFQVQQSFDYDQLNNANAAHWDVIDNYAISAGSPVKIDSDVIAPALRIVYTNGASVQAHLRIWLRVFGINRG